MLFRELLHPEYRNDDFLKWRHTYQGGRRFIEQYLEKYSARESDDDFKLRKKISYCPAFAKSAINEVRNAIFQRMNDISRLNGSDSYQKACAGDQRGVDRQGSNMNSFMGTVILPELLTMRKVAIYVDRPRNLGNTLLDSQGKIPYIYYYPAEAIRSWKYNDDGNLQSLLLEDSVFSYFSDLPTGIQFRYRLLTLVPEGVQVDFYDYAGASDQTPIESYVLNIPEIPCVIGEISDSLLTDIADYQIALLNVASSDLGYILKANYPFYTEQYDQATQNDYLKPDTENVQKEANIGTTQGRKYPKGLERPGFIHPSSEPLTVSMLKQEKMKEEIRLLLQLTISTLTSSRNASAESKGFDERTLENGLSYLGLELEYLERQVAKFWGYYENNDPAVIKYPTCYSLKTDNDIQIEVTQILGVIAKVGCIEFKRKLLKRVALLTLGNKITNSDLQEIYDDIDQLQVIDDPINLIADLEAGVVDPETVSVNKDYPEGSVAKAQDYQEKRLAAIAISQEQGAAAARGISDKSTAPNKDAQQAKKEGY